MAIPQGEMSAVPVPADYLVPDGYDRTYLQDFELGPRGISDVGDNGLREQEWEMLWLDPSFKLIPKSIGSPSTVHSASDVKQMSFTFDQNGNVNILYTDGITTTLYWFDPLASMYVTWAMPDTTYGMMLSLDDKRDLQSAASDVILWYTRKIGAQYNLYNRLQRERFLTEHLMVSDTDPYIYKAGMHKELRGQITIADKLSVPVSPPPIIPPGPPQANLDFELGDVYWNKTGDFAINLSDPYEGLWSATLNTDALTYSTLENTVFTAITIDGPVFVSCIAKGTVATQIALGFNFYTASKSLISTYTEIKNITTNWEQLVYSLMSPPGTVYVRIFVESNATEGTVSLDDFNFFELLDIGAFFTVELDATVYFKIELDEPTLFEVEL